MSGAQQCTAILEHQAEMEIAAYESIKPIVKR
jgi:hypothetical protein